MTVPSWTDWFLTHELNIFEIADYIILAVAIYEPMHFEYHEMNVFKVADNLPRDFIIQNGEIKMPEDYASWVSYLNS